MLDILLFREERGNDPERIRESQRRRYASVELVDEVIKLDKEWRQRQYEVDNIRKEVNKVQDCIKKKKMAKEDPGELLQEKSRLEEAKLAKEKETADCKAAMEASADPATYDFSGGRPECSLDRTRSVYARFPQTTQDSCRSGAALRCVLPLPHLPLTSRSCHRRSASQYQASART